MLAKLRLKISILLAFILRVKNGEKRAKTA